MRNRALKAFRLGSLAGGVLALVLTPAIPIWDWIILLLLGIVVVFFPWAVKLHSDIVSGTQYRLWHSSNLVDPGTPVALKNLITSLFVVVFIAAAMGHWLSWPDWWVVLYKRGILGGPGLATFLFISASMYQTAIRVADSGAVKRCSNDHEFSPFDLSCPYCSAEKGLELVIDEPRS